MGTAGSDSVSGRWGPLRTAAATAREMLVAAAAATWKVPAADCVAEQGVVRHKGSRREAAFGTLVAAASGLPVPTKPALKAPGRTRSSELASRASIHAPW